MRSFFKRWLEKDIGDERRRPDPLLVEAHTDLKNLTNRFNSFVEIHRKDSEERSVLLNKTAKLLDRHLVRTRQGIQITKWGGAVIAALVGWTLEAHSYVISWLK